MFSRLLDWAIRKEPAIAAGGAGSIVSTIATLLALWGIPMSDTTQTALVSTGSVLIPAFMGLAVFIRQVVVPTPKAEAAVSAALQARPPEPGISKHTVKKISKDILKSTHV